MHQRQVRLEPEPFFGRDNDVALVLRTLRQATAERGPAIFIAGDRGIGKSRLLSACAREANSVAHVVALDGTSFRDATDGLYERITAKGRRRPFLIALDDFDKIAPRELEIADRLLDAARRLPILIVAAMQRTSVTSSPVAACVNEALVNGSSKHVLPPLGFADVRLLVQSFAASRGCELGAAVTAEIIATAEGNPRFVRELVLQALSESPPLDALIPASAIAAVGAFKSTISRAACDVLSVASVTGDRFCGSWLAGLSGQDDTIVLQALQAASDAGLLREVPELPDNFVFTNRAMRKALGASLLSRRRQRLHAGIAAMLLRLEVEAPYDCLAAEHLAASNAASAPAWLQKAGTRMLAAGESVAAAELYESAARRAEDSGKRIELFRASTRAYAASGMLERAIGLREELAQLLRENSDDGGLAETLLSLFFDYAVAERWASARQTVEEIGGLHFPDPTDIKVYANMAWAIHLAQAGDMERARSTFEFSQIWKPTCPRGGIMRRLASAVVFSRERPFEETMTLFDEAAHAATDARHAGFMAMSQILAFEVATTLGQMPAARKREAACRTALAGLRQSKGVHNSYAIRHATFCVLSGDLDAARDALRSILDVPNPGRGFESFTQGIGTFVAARTGNWHAIQALFASNLLEADVERHTAEAWGILLRGFAEIATARGLANSLSACVHRLIQAGLVDAHLWIQLTAAEHGCLEDLPVARRQILSRANATDRLVVAAALAMFDAHGARRQGRPMKAKQAAFRAAEAYESLGWPIFQARALELAGNPTVAATLYAKCRASADLKRLQAVATRHKRRAAFSAPLTLREREVAALVARGLANREIATALHTSAQTVHHHVTAILGKLGLKSRWQVTLNVIQPGS